MRERRHIAGLGLVVLIAALAGACAETKDVTISGTVKTKLAADTHVQGIEVQTNGGVVTLTGNVDSQEMKDRALQIARDTKGVTQVKDMISVREGAASGDAPSPSRTLGEHVDDAGITMRVKNRLLEDPAVKGLKIDVDTREGVVYLTGSIPGAGEREKAVQIARSTEGVRDVQANFQ